MRKSAYSARKTKIQDQERPNRPARRTLVRMKDAPCITNGKGLAGLTRLGYVALQDVKNPTLQSADASDERCIVRRTAGHRVARTDAPYLFDVCHWEVQRTRNSSQCHMRSSSSSVFKKFEKSLWNGPLWLSTPQLFPDTSKSRAYKHCPKLLEFGTDGTPLIQTNPLPSSYRG
ncbi:unnamed protein product, partial [Nesidiocoris tenuis]